MTTSTLNINGQRIEVREVHGRPSYRPEAGRIWWDSLSDALSEAEE